MVMQFYRKCKFLHQVLYLELATKSSKVIVYIIIILFIVKVTGQEG